MAQQPVRWGVLGVSKFAMTKVIPAMRHCSIARIDAIASRDLAKAQAAAVSAGIAKAYGSYEALLEDPDIDVIYNPLPNHLHVHWSVAAVNAGKHVLCEKPIGMNASEVHHLIAERDLHRVQAAEAFMIRTHPQWLEAITRIRDGVIGDVRSVQTAFSYFNKDAANIRNQSKAGGGALMDIGCYAVHLSRWVFNAEPTRAFALIDRDPAFGTDRLTSGILDFPGGQASFVCSTQQIPYQRVNIFGDRGRIEIEIPFNAPPNEVTRIYIDSPNRDTVEIPACDQYTLQGDRFSRAVLGLEPVAVPLEDARANMAAIDALLASEASGSWATV